MANYNHAQYLHTSLGGLCGQTRPADEIIVVDDGSTDNSLQIINEYAARHSNMKVICNGSNKGVFHSIERALEICQSEYIALLAADDRILPGFVEKSMGVFEKHWWAGLCFSAYAVMDSETEEIHDFSRDPASQGAFELQRYTEYMTPLDFRKQLRGGNIWMSSNTVVLRKAVFLEAGGLNKRLRWHTDWFMNAVAALRYGACVVPEVLSAIRTRRADSFSGQAYEQVSAQRQVIRNIVRELYRPRFWDIWWTFFRHPVLFSPLDMEVLPVLVGTPLGWPFAAGYARYCMQAGIPMRMEGCAAKLAAKVSEAIRKSVRPSPPRVKELPSKTTVSVLMANYNHARYLEESLTAFCSQTRLPDELIIIDDGSTDNSLGIIEAFAHRYPFIRVLRNDRNRGQMYSVNRALAEAKGDYINWAAADDRVAPSFLEKALSAIERHPGVGVCQAEYALFYEDHGAFAPQREVANVFNFGRMPEYLPPWRYREWLKDEIVWLSTNGALVQRDALLEMGAYHAEMEWHADWFSVQVAALRYGLCVVPEPLAALRVQATSYSADGMRDITRQERVMNAMFGKLSLAEYQDIRRDFFKFPVIISALGHFIYEHMKRTPRLWHYLFRHYLWAIAATLAIKRPVHTCMVALHRKANRIRGIPHKMWHIFQLRCAVELLANRAKDKGIIWIVSKAAKKTLIFLAWFISIPISSFGHLLGFRRITIFTDRIGHLAAEFDCFEKERRLGRLPPRRYWFVLAPRNRVANSHLLNYWKPYFHVVSHPLACLLLKVITWKGFMVHDISDYILSFGQSARYYEVNVAWGIRPPILSLSDADHKCKRALLMELGLPADAWYVCFHNREGGFSPQDEVIHSHRNANVDSLISAMQFVVNQGGWCIRMGDQTMKPLPSIPGVVDYAHHVLRSERADVLLCAGCRYFVGNSSGLWILASIFGVPCALANMIPTTTLGYSPIDISIPKLLALTSENRPLSFPSIFSQPLADFRISSQYRLAGITPLNNTPEEICELVQEMHGVITGTWHYDSIDEALQAKFRKLWRPGHYGYGAGGRTGAFFLRRHQKLLEE